MAFLCNAPKFVCNLRVLEQSTLILPSQSPITSLFNLLHTVMLVTSNSLNLRFVLIAFWVFKENFISLPLAHELRTNESILSDKDFISNMPSLKTIPKSLTNLLVRISICFRLPEKHAANKYWLELFMAKHLISLGNKFWE